MSVAGAMAGSCVSLMKHWEGCCLFQGSGGSLVCQDALPGWRGGCQRTPRPRLPCSCPRLLPSAIPRVQRPALGPSLSTACLSPPFPSEPSIFSAMLSNLSSSKSASCLPGKTPQPHSCVEDPVLALGRVPPSLDVPSLSLPAWGTVVT